METLKGALQRRAAAPAPGVRERIEQIFGRRARATSLQDWTNAALDEDVVYDLFIALPSPRRMSFRGRDEVRGYLAVVQETYQLLAPGVLQIISAGDRLLVLGSEIAYLTRLDQIVQAQWAAHIELTSGSETGRGMDPAVDLALERLSEITRTVHGWRPVCSDAGLASCRKYSIR